jgi:phage tail protein X
VSGNVSAGNGGGIYNQGTSSITNATIAANNGTQASGPGLGSGIYGATGSVTLTNSLIAQQVNGANCNSGLSGGGNNLDDDGTCPTATVASAQIGPLANNGGPTLTHALLVGSPAINAGNDSVCGVSPVNGVDQRGSSRTVNTCDIGAFEYLAAVVSNFVAEVPALDPKYLVLLILLLLVGGARVIRLR